MKSYARWLFGMAAVFNIALGLALLFLRPLLASWLGIEPAQGENLVLGNLAGLLAGLIGCIYALISSDPVRYRPIIGLAVVGKLLAVVCVIVPWLRGEISGSLPVLVMGDVIFAGLFANYLRRTRA
jgi:hypothetical protein